MISENKYEPGDVVYDRTRPAQKLVVKRYENQLYYCKPQENLNQKELVYFERELVTNLTYAHLLTSSPKEKNTNDKAKGGS